MKQIYFLIAVFFFCIMGANSQVLPTVSSSEHIVTVFDYQYAPGQHAQSLATIDKADEIKEKFKGTSTGYVLLGGWGGFITGGFDHSVMNRTGYDFGVYSQPGTGDEPGVVYVMQDVNGNGQPDDIWYELEGNVVGYEGYIRNYEVTYFKPGTDENTSDKVTWQDNQGGEGVLNMSKWWDDSMEQVTFSGVKLPDNKENTSGPFWYDIQGLYTYGYAEVYSADDYDNGKKYNQFDISNAVDANGNTVDLEYIDFIKVQTGCHFEAGWLGEVSTEVSGAVDLNMTDFAATFDDHTLPAESELYADASAAESYESVTENLSSGSFSFKSTATQWGTPESPFTSWYGVALSNKTDNTSLGGVSNQWNSAAGGDINGINTYGVVFDANSGGMSMGPDAAITFNITGHPEGKQLTGCYITNNTYATNSMTNGDGFAKPFGGADGNDEDWFKLTAEGFDKNGQSTGTVDFYLADYRFENNVKDYMLTDWEWMDLSSLGNIVSVQFTMESSDAGVNGMNTPAYFCIDNIDEPRLLLKNTIDDIDVGVNSSDQVIDLSNLFEDPENTDISKEIVWNTNTDLITATIEDEELKLQIAEGMSGTAEIMLKGISNKMAARTSLTVTVTNPTGIDKNEITGLSVYPVPFNDFITIEGTDMVGSVYSIYNLSCQLVKKGVLNGNNQTVEVSALQPGTYILSVQTKDGVTNQKVVKR